MFLLLLALGIAVQPRKPAIQTRFSKKIALPKNYNNGFGCDMCTKVVQYVEQLLKDQTVESEIAVLVEQLCVTFPSPYDTLCKSVVESYLPTVLQWIESGLEALDICTKIGLCSTTKKAINIRKIVLPKKYDNGFACDMCTQVVQYVEQLLKDQTVESEIEALVDQYCAKLASPYDSLCKTAVDESLEFIMKMLESGLEALDICTKIGLCPTTKKALPRVKKISLPATKNYNNGFGCDMCTKVVQYIEKLLEDQTVEEEIATLVEQLCTTFSTPYDSLCKTVIEQYLPSVLQWIEQDIEALDICTTIGLCSESKKVVVARRFSDFKSEEGCQTCKNWFKWAQDKLDEVTVEGLWKLVSEECPKVPYLKYFCQVINEQNIETLVSLISSALPPEQCCKWIKVC